MTFEEKYNYRIKAQKRSQVYVNDSSFAAKYRRRKRAEQYSNVDISDEKRHQAEVDTRSGEIEDFFDRYNALVTRYNSVYGEGQWQSESQRNAWYETLGGYLNEAAEWEKWAKSHEEEIGSDFKQGINNIWQQIGGMQNSVREASKVYSRYSNTDEYNAAVRESEYFDKYYGLDSTAIQGYITDLTRSGENTEVRKLTDEESGQISADLNRELANAESRYNDAFEMWRAGDYDMAIVARLKKERDQAKARLDSFNSNPTYYAMPAVNKNQAEIDWLNNYVTMADYYAGAVKYDIDLTQLNVYELIDYIDGISDIEQRKWAEDYMNSVSASAGHISTDEYRRVAEGQRVLDNLGSGTIYDSLYNAAEKYLDVRSYAYDRSAYIDGNHLATSRNMLNDMGEYDVLANDIAAATGMSYEEVQQQVKNVLPYVAFQRSQKDREQIRAMAQETPYAATALTWLVSPVANVTADLSVLGSKLLGTELTSYDPNLYGYYYVSDTRDQVSSDLSEKYTDQTFWGTNRAEWIYDVVNDVLDSASASLYTGGLSNWGGSAVLNAARQVVSSAFASSGVLADKYIDLRQQGYKGAQALGASVMTAVGAGFADYFANTIPMNKLMKSESTFSKMMKWYSKNVASGIGSNWTEAAIDYFWLRNGKGSQRFKALKGLFLGYRRAGFSDREAFYKAWEDFIMNEDFSSFVSGLLSSAVG